MDWGIGPPSQEYKCPPDAASSPPISRIAFCQMNPSCKSATSGGSNANIFGSLEPVKNGFWAWPEFASPENRACHQNQRMGSG